MQGTYNALAHVPKSQHSVVAAALGQPFLQTDQAAAHRTAPGSSTKVRGRWPKLAALLDESEHDVLAYTASPAQHQTKLQCRADVVRSLPSRTQDRQPALVQRRSW